MTTYDLEQRLSDLIAFQCVLVTLRGVGTEASEQMLWQTLLAALVEQYRFRRVWYGCCEGDCIRPVASVPVSAPDLPELPEEMDATSPAIDGADLSVPVFVEGRLEGTLLVEADGPPAGELPDQIRILTSEAAMMIAERRSRLRNEEALKRAKLEAESADRAKSRLLANMSHEIRTPMAAVIGFTNLLADTPLGAEQRDYLENIRSSGEALLTLIDDILDFSKIEAGRLKLESRPFDLRNTVEQVVGLLAVRAAEKELRLSFAIDAAVPRAIVGDVVRLRQILVNLLGNAVKFTAAGEVSLTVSSRSVEDGRHRIAFAVRDTGPGIAPEQQQRIFESFSQADASISRKFGGTGLGLAISRSLVEQMGGSLGVESEPGRGAEFRFSILAEATDQALTKPSGHAPLADSRTADLPTLRVMVAEDNPVSRKLVLMTLKRLGYEAEASVNGVELLERMADHVYDVVFMDVQMPEMDGLEATRRICRDWPRERRPRIVAMTAAAFPEDRAHCLEAGMDDYISKPVDLNALIDVLRRVKPSAGA
jgi:signal transduction histidine kinase/ActR/RegA family two-component response regulator